MRSPLLLCIVSVVGLAASPALAGVRAKTNVAWIETVELAQAVMQAPQATPTELAELDRRMGSLHDEQHRLMDEALWLDAEEAWLVDAAAGINEEKRKYQGACDVLTDEAEIAPCQAQARAINEKVDAYNARHRPFASREGRYNQGVRAWLAELETMRGWLRPILSRRGLAADERRLLEREREKLRADVDGIQEALRRLAQSHESTEADRADWERRYQETAARASERLKDFLADQALELAQAAFAKGSERLTNDLRAKIDERINVAGGSAADKAERVKALDEQIARLISSRADVDSAGPALSRAVAALEHGFAALEPGFTGDREKVLLEMQDIVGDALGDPLVQRALRISEAPATVFTYAKLIADSSYDVTTEVLSILRLRDAIRGSERYLDDVRRLDEQLKRKVARIQEISRALDAK